MCSRTRVGGTWCRRPISFTDDGRQHHGRRLYQLHRELTAMGHDEWNDYYAQSGDSSWEWTAGNGSTTLTRGGESHVIPHSTPTAGWRSKGPGPFLQLLRSPHPWTEREILPPRDHASVSGCGRPRGGAFWPSPTTAARASSSPITAPTGPPVPCPYWTAGRTPWAHAGTAVRLALVGGLIELLTGTPPATTT